MYRLFVETEPEYTIGIYGDEVSLQNAVGSLARMHPTKDGFLIIHPVNRDRPMRAEKIVFGRK